MNIEKGEAPTRLGDEASVSNQTLQGKTDMDDFTTDQPIKAMEIGTPALVPVFMGTLQGQLVQLCDARTLHTFMGVLRDFSNWIKGRIRKFKFVEGVDFITVKLDSPVLANQDLSSPDLASAKHGGDRKSIDYHLTLDMAKELSMVENNDKGREARRYFIACEKLVLSQLSSNPLQLPSNTSSIAPYSVHPGQTLSEDQAQTLRTLLDDFVKTLPKEKQAGFMRKGWSKLKSHFDVGYRQIPAAQFTDAVSIIARHIVEYSTPALPAPAQEQLDLSTFSFKNQRLMVSYDHNGKELIQRMRNEQMLADFDEFADILKDHFLMPSMAQLVRIVNAGVAAIGRRAGYGKPDPIPA